MSSSQDTSSTGRKKAVLIAVRNVKGIRDSLYQAHSDARELKELLIKHDYAEDDIIMLLHDGPDKSFWPSKKNIICKIKWLVEDVRENDRLVFYYSGHGGQTICRHGSEEDGKDEAIYTYTGHKIIDNDLKQLLVDPVLRIKDAHLFALFDCCHSETILDLKHGNCCFPLLPPVESSVIPAHTTAMDVTEAPVSNKWRWFFKECRLAPSLGIPWESKNISHSIIERVNCTLGNLRNRIARMLKGLRKCTTDGLVQVPSMKPSISIITAVDPQPNSIMSPCRTVMSPVSIIPNAACHSACVMTEQEQNEGHVVCLSACRDSELAHDDNKTGETLTKFFMSSLKRKASISYQGLLDDIQSQVAGLQTKRVAYMQRHPPASFQPRRRMHEVTSESGISSIMRKGSTQEPRISSNRPFDFNKKVSF